MDGGVVARTAVAWSQLLCDAMGSDDELVWCEEGRVASSMAVEVS